MQVFYLSMFADPRYFFLHRVKSSSFPYSYNLALIFFLLLHCCCFLHKIILISFVKFFSSSNKFFSLLSVSLSYIYENHFCVAFIYKLSSFCIHLFPVPCLTRELKPLMLFAIPVCSSAC